MKIVFSVTGIGQPHFEHKCDILRSNLDKLTKLVSRKNIITVIISFYDNSPIPDWIYTIENLYIKIINEQNYVGSFIQKHLSPNDLSFDYIFLILDDVQLPDNLSLSKMISTYENKYRKNKNKTILSCTLSPDSSIGHQYMVTRNQKHKKHTYQLRKETKCEYFFYLMNNRSYKRYYSIINSYPEFTERMWGIDLLLKKYHLSAYLSDDISCKHFYSHGPGQSANICVNQMTNLLAMKHPVYKK